MTPSIVIIGSTNTDMVIKSHHLPEPGETILGGNFFMNSGGKGANQAVAAARLGGKVIFIGKTGEDGFGKQAILSLEKEDINTSYMIRDQLGHSGIALITVDRNGENCIVVAPGANGTFTPSDLQSALPIIEKASIILLQLEIPLETVEYVAGKGSAKGIKVVMNPAPAQTLPDSLYSHVSVITPNQKEAEMLTGIKVFDRASAEEAARSLHAKGVETVIITMAEKGALLYLEEKFIMIPAPRVLATDTTAAGDVFTGALVVGMIELKMQDAVAFACKAASISVTRIGAQSSAPYREEVERLNVESHLDDPIGGG